MTKGHNLFRRMGQSNFAIDVSILVRGHVIAALLPVLAAPILGRLYLPADYGILAIYAGLCSTFSLLSNWEYARAIPIQRSLHRAEAIMALCFSLAGAGSIVALLIVIAAHVAVGTWLAGLMPHSLLFLAPVSALLSGVTLVLLSHAQQQTQYSSIATHSIIGAIASATVSIGLGIMAFGGYGLVAAYVTSQAISLLFLMWCFWRNIVRSLKTTSAVTQYALSLKYQTFPLHTVPATFMRNLALSLPIYSLAAVGAVDVAGHLARANALMSAPINLVGTAIARVFEQRASVQLQTAGTFWLLYCRVAMVIAIGSLPMVTILAILAPTLFEVVLGPSWVDTGYYARILAPALYLRMIAGPLWPTYSLMKANKSDLVVASTQFVGVAVAVSGVMYVTASPLWHVVIFSGGLAIMSVVHIAQTAALARRGL